MGVVGKHKLNSLAVVLLAASTLGLSGCLLLALGGLGYTGYQYEKTGKIPGMPDTSSQSSNSQQRKPAAKATPDYSNIE